MPAREWTAEQDALVRQLYDGGLTTTQMGLQLDIPRTTVQERIYALQLHARPAARPRAGWSPEKDARLIGLWADKTLSTAAIGRQMGISKNAVIGRVHRLKLPARPSPIKVVGETGRYLRSFKARAPKRQSASQQPLSGPTLPQLESARAPALAYPIARAAIAPRIAFSAGAARTCQWIEGEADGVDTQFCGARSVLGCSWCAEHRQRVFTRTPDRMAA